MSNRIHSSRLDFSSGWVIHHQRYGVPGAPAEMSNVQLDLLSEGALRPTWGFVPFAFKGDVATADTTSSQYRSTPHSEGRYPGIGGIEVIEVGDGDSDDTVIVVDQNRTTADTCSSKFYWIRVPQPQNKIMNAPFGTTYSFTSKTNEVLTFEKGHFIYLMGEPRSSDPRTSSGIPITAAKVSGTGAIADTGSRFTYTAPGSTGMDTLSITLTHDVTAEVVTFTVYVDVVSTVAINPKYSIQCPVPLSYNTPCSTETVADEIAFSPTRSEQTITAYPLAGTASAGIGDYMGIGATFGVYSNVYLKGLPPVEWEQVGTATNYFTVNQGYELGGGAFLIVGSGSYYYYYPVGPAVNYFDVSPSSTVSEFFDAVEMSTGMFLCNTVSTAQPQSGPLGIWKSATMNGDAHWFNGYSGTSFKMDSTDPTTTATIGKSRPDASGMTAGTFTKGNNDGQHPKRLHRYWISEIDGDGLESGISEDYVDFDNKDWSNEGVRLSNIPAAADSASHIRIYRSIRDRTSPLLLHDQKTYNDTNYDDIKADEELGDPPWTHGDRPPYDFFSPVVYYDRLWGLGTRPGVDNAVRTTLFWSDINEPESFWWDGNWANVYGDDGDLVTALVRDKTGLIVFKNNHMYLMSGRSPQEISFNELTVEDSDTGVGCPHPNALVATDAGVFFYWNRGIYRYFQGQVVKISRVISPLLEGYDTHFPSRLDVQWPYYGKPDDWSVQMSYDPVSMVVYIGMRGTFPNIESMPEEYFEFVYPDVVYDPNPNSLFNPGITNELTLLLDASNARWIGMYTFDFGFMRRAKVSLYNQWHTRTTRTTTQGSSLIGAYLGNDGVFLGFDFKHPIMAVPSTSLMNTVPIWQMVKFRPVSGNLGPYMSKRFIGLDYLMDDDGAAYNSAASKVQSYAYLDASTTPASTTSLTVQGGAIYSDRVRHTLGLVGSEIEAQLYFDKDRVGGVARLFEYGVAWQNLGREKAEHPGRAAASPKGGVALTGPPVALR